MEDADNHGNHDNGSHNNSSDGEDQQPMEQRDKNGNGPMKREKTAAEIRKVSAVS